MSKFTDNKGREWPIEITIGTTMRLKGDGIKFHELAENKYAKFLALEREENSDEFAALLWAVIRPDAEEKGITSDDFFNSLEGDSLFRAWEAFSNAYVNFIRNPEIRSSLKGILERSRAMQERVAKVLHEKANRMEELGQERINEILAAVDDQKMRQEIDSHFEKTLLLSKQSEPSSVLPDS